MSIRAYKGELPVECRICLEQESNSKSLIQTTCCRANTIATQIIPKTYHKNCMMEWARRLPDDYFSCVNCQRKILKSELFSKIDRMKQFLFSPIAKKYFKCTAKISIKIWSQIAISIVVCDFLLNPEKKDICYFNHKNFVRTTSALGVLSICLISDKLMFREFYIMSRLKKYSWVIVGASIFSNLIMNVFFKTTTIFLNYRHNNKHSCN